MTYQLFPAPALGVLRLADNAFIPDDPLNRDWAEYQQWLAAGNTPEPAPAPPPPSSVVTKRQMLLWLFINKRKSESDIIAALNTIADPTARQTALIGFNYPDGPFRRGDALFDALGPLFAMSPADIDAAFAAAAQL